MLLGRVGQSKLLELTLSDQDTGKFPQAEIYNSSGSLVTTINLTHVAKGQYQGAWASPTLGSFSILYLVYNEAGHTTRSTHEPGSDLLDVLTFSVDTIPGQVWEELKASHVTSGSFGEAVRFVLGHMGHFVVDEELTHDANNRPLTMRRRIFTNSTDVANATPGGSGEGEILTLTFSAAHLDAQRMQIFRGTE